MWTPAGGRIALREFDFIVVGAAQKLDIAMEAVEAGAALVPRTIWKIGIAPDRVPLLQKSTYPPCTTNGETELRTHGGAIYMPRTFDGARGHSAARLMLDEPPAAVRLRGLGVDREVRDGHEDVLACVDGGFEVVGAEAGRCGEDDEVALGEHFSHRRPCRRTCGSRPL